MYSMPLCKMHVNARHTQWLGNKERLKQGTRVQRYLLGVSVCAAGNRKTRQNAAPRHSTTLLDCSICNRCATTKHTHE